VAVNSTGHSGWSLYGRSRVPGGVTVTIAKQPSGIGSGIEAADVESDLDFFVENG
jgi:hypothetical protein